MICLRNYSTLCIYAPKLTKIQKNKIHSIFPNKHIEFISELHTQQFLISFNQQLPSTSFYKKNSIFIGKNKPKEKCYKLYIKSKSNKEADLYKAFILWALHSPEKQTKTIFFTKNKSNWKINPKSHIITLPFSYKNLLYNFFQFTILIDTNSINKYFVFILKKLLLITNYFKSFSHIHFIKSDYDLMLFKEMSS